MVADRFRLRYRLTREHYQSFSKLAFHRLKKKRSWKTIAKLLPFSIGIALLVGFLLKNPYWTPNEGRMLVIGMLLGIILLFLLYLILKKTTKKQSPDSSRDAMVGEFKLTAYERGGIQVSSQHIQASYDWSAFLDLTQGAEYLVLWFGPTGGIIIPNKAFSKDDEKQDFVDFVNERIDAHKPIDE